MKPPSLAKVVAFAVNAHGDQKDKAGEPYILHLFRVMEAMPHGNLPLMRVAVLHDIVEDTSVTLLDLYKLGLPQVEVEAVSALTRRKGRETYAAYLQRVKEAGAFVTHVKMVDLADNMRPERLRRLPPEKAASLTKRYTKALAYLGGEET